MKSSLRLYQIIILILGLILFNSCSQDIDIISIFENIDFSEPVEFKTEDLGEEGVRVTLTTKTQGVQIYYDYWTVPELDYSSGSPQCMLGYLYTEPFVVQNDTEIYAFACGKKLNKKGEDSGRSAVTSLSVRTKYSYSSEPKYEYTHVKHKSPVTINLQSTEDGKVKAVMSHPDSDVRIYYCYSDVFFEGAMKLYTEPFELEGTVCARAYLYDESQNKLSPLTELTSYAYYRLKEKYTYVVEPSIVEPNRPDPVYGKLQKTQNGDYTLSLSCETTGTEIYYAYGYDYVNNELEDQIKYTEPFVIPADTYKIYVIARKSGMQDSEMTTIEIHKNYITEHTEETVYDDIQSTNDVYITCNCDQDNEKVFLVSLSSYYDATIYYTLDGSIPNKNSSIYTEPFEVTSGCRINAFAVSEGKRDSAVSSAVIKIQERTDISYNYITDVEKHFTEPVSFSTEEDLENYGIKLTMSCVTPESKIYYTTDGTDPTSQSTEYTSPISLANNTKIKAVAIKEGLENSSICYAIYDSEINTVYQTVELAHSGSVFFDTEVINLYDRKVTLSTDTEGAKIYYNLNYNNPTTESTLYTEPIIVNKQTVIKAFSVKEDLEPGPVCTYTIYASTNDKVTPVNYYVCPNCGTIFTKSEDAKNCCGIRVEDACTSNHVANASPVYVYYQASPTTTGDNIADYYCPDAANAPNRDGFYLAGRNSFIQDKVYHAFLKRKSITYIFTPGEHGHFSDNMETKTFTGLYEGTIQVLDPPVPDSENYYFAGWKIIDSDKNFKWKFDTQDFTIQAQWAENNTLLDDFVKINKADIDKKIANNSNVKKALDNYDPNGFYICKHEVTEQEFFKYYKYTTSYFPYSRFFDISNTDNYPIHYVYWNDALKYCNYRSIEEGLTPCYSKNGNTDPAKLSGNDVQCDFTANGYRLPTYPEYCAVSAIGNQNGLDEPRTSPIEVMTSTPNELGIYELEDNVSEWTWDYWEDYKDVSLDPNFEKQKYKIWYGSDYSGDHKWSGYFYPYAGQGYDFLGFRVVRTVTE